MLNIQLTRSCLFVCIQVSRVEFTANDHLYCLNDALQLLESGLVAELNQTDGGVESRLSEGRTELTLPMGG